VIPKTEEQRARIAKAVEGNLLFTGLDEQQLADVYLAMEEKKFAAGGTVMTQGEDGDYFYVVDSGTVKVIVSGTEVATLGAGDSFGELALMYFAPRAATIAVDTDAVMWAMDRVTFRSMLLDSTARKRATYESFLATVPLLSPLEAYERSKIADILKPQTITSGAAIVTEGDAGDCFFIIESGTADATKTDLPDYKLEYGVGDFFGELSLLKNSPRGATVTATSDCKVVTVNHKQFSRMIGKLDEALKATEDAYKAQEEAAA